MKILLISLLGICFLFSAELEKKIANEIVSNECNVENDVTKKLTNIMDTNISAIQKQKRIVTKLMQDNESAKHKYQVRRCFKIFILLFDFVDIIECYYL